MSSTPDAGPRTVALLNQKGGVGKTTTTANLGHALAVAGMRVCLIDLDPQGHLTLHLGIEPGAVSHTVYDLMIDPDVPIRDCIVKDARPNLDVILAEVDLAAVEQELADHPSRQSVLRDRFAEVAADYDVVLLDCPPSLGLLTVNALTMADELMMPMQAHFLALQGVGRLLETVSLVTSSVNPSLTVSGVVLCMYERQTTLAREIVSDLEEFFEGYRGADVPWANASVLKPPIRRNIKLAEAPSFGNTIFDYAPWCPGAIDYRRLAANLLETWGRALEGLDVPDPEADADLAAPSGAVAAVSGDSEPEPTAVTSVAPPVAALDQADATDAPAVEVVAGADGAIRPAPSTGPTSVQSVRPPQPADEVEAMDSARVDDVDDVDDIDEPGGPATLASAPAAVTPPVD